MFKLKMITVLNLLFVVSSLMACSDSSDDDKLYVEKQDYPLSAFAVQVGDSYYHANINQETHVIEIPEIENANTISSLSFTVQEGATIEPNPNNFINNWKKEQTIVVTTTKEVSTTYTILLSAFVEQVPDEDNDVEDDREYIFVEEFDVDGIPNPDIWILAKKGGSDWNDEMSESYDQAYVKDGRLILVAEKKDGKYLAGGIETEGKFAFTFGRIEVRAKISSYPNGAFPAIWLMPYKSPYPGWPYCGELDIMEHIKQEPYIYQTVHTHYTYNLKQNKDPKNHTTANCDISEYNIYGMEWTPDELRFFVNGEQTFSYPNLRLEDEAEKMQWPFTKDSEFYIILNMGLGGRTDSWAGLVDDENLPAVMEVDWVRISKLDELNDLEE